MWICGELGSDALCGAREPRLEAEDRLRVQLRDPRLGHAEHLADLAERQLLVVVERDYELLALGQARDRIRERLAHPRLVERLLRTRAGRVLDRVEQRDLVTLARDRPELVERGDRGTRDVGQRLLELVDGDPDLGRDLLVGGRRAELRLELGDRPLDLAGARTDGARHPVERAELVDDRALDPRDRVDLELDVAAGVVALDRADQPEQAVGDEVALVDVRGQAAAEAPGHELDERRIGQDQAIAQRAIVARPELAPESFGVFGHGFPRREYGAARPSPPMDGATGPPTPPPTARAPSRPRR